MSDRDDSIWRTAWDWVTREHEQPLSADSGAELLGWLQANPVHRQTYDQAARLWLLTGLIPPSSAPPTQSDDTDH